MKHRLITGALLLVIAISVLYVFLGNNWLEEQQYIQKEKNQDFVRNNLMHRLLEIQDQSEEIINQLLRENYKMELIPQKNVDLELHSLIKLENDLSLNPQFDLKFMYLGMGRKLAVYSKISLELEWELDFEYELNSLSLLDANRIMVHTSNGKLICLNREKGKILWEQSQLESAENEPQRSMISEISLNKYHQLDSSIILVPDNSELILLNSINGDEIAKLELGNRVEYISAFDQFERCVYLSSGKEIYKINFRISY